MQVKDILQKTTDFFRNKGFESPRLETELLISSALHWERMKLYLNHEQPLSEAEVSACREFVRRRASGEPVAYIVGHKGFYKHSFRVTPAVLIPRPETEGLVEEALKWAASQGFARTRAVNKSALAESAAPAATAGGAAPGATAGGAAPGAAAGAAAAPTVDGPAGAEANHRAAGASAAGAATVGDALRIVDLGAGSGCVGISMLAALPSAKLFSCDISDEALKVAQTNAQDIGVLDRATYLTKDAAVVQLSDLTMTIGGAADIVLANPPYIAEDDPEVQDSVRKFEPHAALFSDDHGYAHIKSWAQTAARIARAGAFVMFEIGHEQGARARQIFEGLGEFENITIEKDLAGLERFIRATKRQTN